MKLLPFLKSKPVPERRKFAERCGTTYRHLMNVAYGDKPCGARLAIAVDKESKGISSCEENAPELDWAYLRGSTKRPSRVTTRKCG